MLSIGPCLGLGPYLPAPTVRLGAAPCSQRTADAPSRRRQAPRASSAAPAAAAAVRGGRTLCLCWQHLRAGGWRDRPDGCAALRIREAMPEAEVTIVAEKFDEVR